MFFCAGNVIGYAQKFSTLVANGDKAVAEKDYFGATLYYNKAMEKDSSGNELRYKYAEALRLNFDYVNT